jgi:hypothetical protein
MTTKVAYCGLACDGCPIYLATQESDLTRKHAIRESVAQQLYEYYKILMQPEDINDCYGCQANTTKMFTGCIECIIRVCAVGKKVESCASCSEYPCDNLTDHFSKYPMAKTRLDNLREQSGQQ